MPLTLWIGVQTVVDTESMHATTLVHSSFVLLSPYIFLLNQGLSFPHLLYFFCKFFFEDLGLGTDSSARHSRLQTEKVLEIHPTFTARIEEKRQVEERGLETFCRLDDKVNKTRKVRVIPGLGPIKHTPDSS